MNGTNARHAGGRNATRAAAAASRRSGLPATAPASAARRPRHWRAKSPRSTLLPRSACSIGTPRPNASACCCARRRHLAVRPLLDALYTPPAMLRRPDGDTIVCRCEEITAAEIRGLAALGCPGPNQMKAFTRCGMGPCQGRWCGTTVGELIADVQRRDVGDVGHYRIRAPIKPVTVGEMAGALELSNDFRRGEFPS
jgi:hypothetical protein